MDISPSAVKRNSQIDDTHLEILVNPTVMPHAYSTNYNVTSCVTMIFLYYIEILLYYYYYYSVNELLNTTVQIQKFD